MSDIGFFLFFIIRRAIIIIDEYFLPTALFCVYFGGKGVIMRLVPLLLVGGRFIYLHNVAVLIMWVCLIE